jgi:succinate dehydrogenase / fumarate reductase flavoprotein subunit
VPRDVASRAAKERADEGFGVGDTGLSVYLDFKDAIKRLGADVIRARYGNLFEMYERITAEDPYKVPMRIYPAIHYTMGGLWVDYNLESTVPGLFVLGEANFSDHGANRLGASALMQGLADGYFIAPYTVPNYLANATFSKVTSDHDAFKDAGANAQQRIDQVLGIRGKRTVRQFHRQLGRIMWDFVGMARNESGLKNAVQHIRSLRSEFWQDVSVPGEKSNVNPMLDYAGRVADYMEFGELLAVDALHRNESCGGHFREEFQTPDGEARRDDVRFAYVAAWAFTGVGSTPDLHKEPLTFDVAHPSVRSYK